MKLNLDFSLRKILNNKKFVVAISIVFAFVFWLAIVTGETPTIEKNLTKVAVSLETTGSVVSQLGLDEISGVTEQTVSVKLSGPAYVLNGINSEDITIYASVSEVTKPGTYQLMLSANKKSMAGEYTVVSITPSVITATFDYIDTKEFTVTPKITGVTAVAGLEKGDPIISDTAGATITVKGPRSEMQKIQSVIAFAETNEVLSETKSYDGKISLLDDAGKEIDLTKFTLSATEVKISQPILKSKTVPIKPTYLNAPAGYAETPISAVLSVNEVTIAGPAETIDSLSFIELAPIDFNEITKANSSFDKELVIPNGVTTIDPITTVNVKIDASRFAEKSFTVSNIVAQSNDKNLTVSLKSSIKNVKMCGPSNAIYSVKASDLYAVIDLTDRNQGDYIVTVTIKCDKYPNIWQVGTYQATVKVE